MLRFLFILALTFTHINAQRGGYGGGGSGYGGVVDGDWGENEEPPAQMITQTQTRVQTQVKTQVQTQVRTTVSIAPTTIVQVQATTVVKVATLPTSASANTPSPAIPISSQPSPPPSPDPSSSTSPSLSPDQSQSPLQQSKSEGDLIISDTSPLSPSQVEDGITTKPIGAANEVSAPVTRLTGTVATLKSGMEFRTTGTPNLGDGGEGVVYGHVRLTWETCY